MSETYISVDIEAGGPIPGPNSMLSIGAAAFVRDGPKGVLLDTFSANLKPLPGSTIDPTTKSAFWDKQPDAWAACQENQRDPHEAIGAFIAWVEAVSTKDRPPVFVAYPAGFDFLFVYWYIVRFGYQSPFSFSALDVKSYVSAVLKKPYRQTVKRNMPGRWFPATKHTHVAVEDAIEQGELFMNILIEHTTG
jgi:hypothetical protein